MRFTVRSLGGKLIAGAALTLLLCLLCFSAASLYVLKIFYEHEAKNDATIHLALVQHAYQAQSALLTSELSATASNQELVTALSHPSLASSNEIISAFTSMLTPPDRFSGIAYISSGKSHTLVEPLGNINADQGVMSLAEASLLGKTATLIMPSPGANESSTWDTGFSVPVSRSGTVVGALVGLQRIDNTFAFDLLGSDSRKG